VSLAASRPATGAVLRYLAVVNAIVGAFNLVPGFPLDGGRILRALLWRVRGDVRWATEIASRAGTVIAFALMALGVLRALSGEFLGGLWFVLIGLFLRQAAEGTYQELLVRRALGPIAVRDVMSRNVFQVPPELPLDRVADEWFWRHHVTSFPVVEDGRLLGILSIAQLGAVPRERWPEVRAREVMRPADDALTIEPTARLPAALQKLTQNGLGRLAVVEKGGVVGYLSLKDALHVLAVATAGGFKGERSARTRRDGDEHLGARPAAG
jgi:CBS domain-containing protein